MVKHLKKLVGPLVSLFFLLNMTSVSYAETTVSAEVGFIFNTFLFLVVIEHLFLRLLYFLDSLLFY